MARKKTLEEIKDAFAQKWGDTYSYEKITRFNYIDTQHKVPIVCKKHGVFYATPTKHLCRGDGCPSCKFEKQSTRLKGKPRFERRVAKIMGVGINDWEYAIFDGKNPTKAYQTWVAMLTRCYSERYHKVCPTYIGCSICDEWLRFSNFKMWFDENYVEGYALDKDILVKGNKVYSPDTCCFVPNEINALLIKHEGKRGSFPIGVTRKGNKFCARLNVCSVSKWLGVFRSAEEAFAVYKNEKEKYLKEIAKTYFESNKISEKVYNALINYKVKITD